MPPNMPPNFNAAPIGWVILKANTALIFVRWEYQFIQGVNDAAERRVMVSYSHIMLSYGLFQFRYLGGKFLVGGYGLPHPDEGADY